MSTKGDPLNTAYSVFLPSPVLGLNHGPVYIYRLRRGVREGWRRGMTGGTEGGGGSRL